MYKMDNYQKLALLFGGIGYYMTLIEVLVYSEKDKRARRWWVRDIFKQRESLGHSNQLINEMLLADNESFFNFTRMSPAQFDELLSLVGPKIKKYSFRKPLSEKERLHITLRYLATGNSFSTLSYAFRVSKSTIHNIIVETTEAIWISLNERYIGFPSKERLKEIAGKFFENFNLPNCMGAIDGKHCVIQAPPSSGSLYFNYKKQFSIVLLAVCDAECNFIYVDVGAYGSESDGGVLRRSEFGNKLLQNDLDFPEDSILPGTNICFPHYIIGDEAFPLKRCLFRPYGGRNLPNDRQKFNEKLSKARRLIENSFGLLASRFRIYHTTIIAHPELAKSIVKSTVVLHNYLKSTTCRNYNDSNIVCFAEETPNLRSIRHQGSNHPSSDAMHLRDILKDWINANS